MRSDWELPFDEVVSSISKLAFLSQILGFRWACPNGTDNFQATTNDTRTSSTDRSFLETQKTSADLVAHWISQQPFAIPTQAGMTKVAG